LPLAAVPINLSGVGRSDPTDRQAVSPFSFILGTRLAYDVSTNLER